MHGTLKRKTQSNNHKISIYDKLLITVYIYIYLCSYIYIYIYINVPNWRTISCRLEYIEYEIIIEYDCKVCSKRLIYDS